MHFTITKARMKNGRDVLLLKGNFTIHTAAALYKDMMEQILLPQKGILIQVQEVEAIDISFIQLVLAYGRFITEKQKSFHLELTLSEAQQLLLEQAGFSTSFLKTNQ